MESAQKLFTKMYEQAGAAAGAQLESWSSARSLMQEQARHQKDSRVMML